MKRFIIVMAMLFAILGCVKRADSTIDEQKMNFDWDMTEVQSVSDVVPYDVFNQDGDTIASYITGNFNLHVAEGDKLTKVPSEVSATKAPGSSSIFFPSSGEYATVLVEDLFPYKGDKDFNDAVFGIRYVFSLTDGLVTKLRLDTELRAAGSSYAQIGIALELDGTFDVASSTGGFFRNTFSELFDVDINWLEKGTDHVVIPIIGNLRKGFKTYTEGALNTFNHLDWIAPTNNFAITVNFNTPADYETLYNALNLFIVFESRGREIHLKGKGVTSKFDSSSFSPVFVDDEGFVWMMMIPKRGVTHPQEMVSIYDAYPQFVEWVFQDVANYKKDWYYFPDTEKIYKKNY